MCVSVWFSFQNYLNLFRIDSLSSCSSHLESREQQAPLSFFNDFQNKEKFIVFEETSYTVSAFLFSAVVISVPL